MCGEATILGEAQAKLLWEQMFEDLLYDKIDNKSNKQGRTHRNTHRGVRKRTSGRWYAEIRDPHKGCLQWLGTYGSPEEAARAYDKAAILIRGTKAKLNYPFDCLQHPTTTNNAPPSKKHCARPTLAKAPTQVIGGSLSENVSSMGGRHAHYNRLVSDVELKNQMSILESFLELDHESSIIEGTGDWSFLGMDLFNDESVML